MYNLNYTFLTELEVDTRQTFSDISDDLLLIYNKKDNEKEEKTIKIGTLVTCWQDFFWKVSSSNKEQLKVTFTDISIDHVGSSPFNGEHWPSAKTTNYQVDDNEMMTYEELSAYFTYLDTPDGSEGTGKWAGNRTFTELCCVLLDAIDKLHNKLTATELYPIKSIIVSDKNPNTAEDLEDTSWDKQNPAYISENMMGVMSGTELKTMGYHAGQTMNGTIIGNDLEKARIKPELKASGLVPKHDHKLKFDPESGSGGDSNETNAGPYDTFADFKQGSDGSPYSGANKEIITGNDVYGLAVAKQANYSASKEGERFPSFNVSSTVKNPIINSINVAPKTYPLSAFIWERVS